MKEDADEFGVGRIVVELDASVWEFSRVQSALHLAARLKVRLLARFVEDADLLRLAGLPASQEVRWSDGSLRPLDPSHTRRALRIRAERARRRLLSEAEKVRVECTFETVQGKTFRLQWDAQETDLLVIGPGRRVSRAATASGPWAWSVLALCEGGEASRRVLTAASRIAETLGRRLQAIVVCPDTEAAGEIRREVASWLETHGSRADVWTVDRLAPDRLPEPLEDRSVVPVFSRSQTFVSPEFLKRVLDAVDMAVAVP